MAKRRSGAVRKKDNIWIWIAIAVLIIIAVAVYLIIKSAETQESPQLAGCESVGDVSCGGHCQPAGRTCSSCPGEKPFMIEVNGNNVCSASPTA